MILFISKENNMKFRIFLFLLAFTNCDNKGVNYHGYVFDTDKLPVSGVLVKENWSSLSTTTDKTGYFVLAKSPNSIKDLIFSKIGYENDTVKTVWTQHGYFLTMEWILLYNVFNMVTLDI